MDENDICFERIDAIIKDAMKSEFFSIFYNNAMFGGFPTQENADYLEKIGTKYFINLTFDNEKKIKPYNLRKGYYYTFPIKDKGVPTNIHKFCVFILKLMKIIKEMERNGRNEKIYIHCKGGHGRSGVVVACLVILLNKVSAEDGLRLTSEYHSQRDMKSIWKNIGSPQTKQQKKFVTNLFKDCVFYRVLKNHSTTGFSNFSPHTVKIPGIGEFPTSEAAFQSQKCPADKNYVNRQLSAKTPAMSKKLGNNIEYDVMQWEKEKVAVMRSVVRLKFEQHPELMKNLLDTGFQMIISNDKNDSFWGIGKDGKGRNMLGMLLMEIRDDTYALVVDQFRKTF